MTGTPGTAQLKPCSWRAEDKMAETNVMESEQPKIGLVLLVGDDY
jgi:hypothetical protein